MVRFPWNSMEDPWSVPEKIHGNTMDFSWSIPWIYHGYLIIDHGFVISTMHYMKNPWNSHGFPMYFPSSIDGISSWFFEYGHRNTWVFHGSDHGFPWNNHGFPKSLPCYFLWIFYGLAPVDFDTELIIFCLIHLLLVQVAVAIAVDSHMLQPVFQNSKYRYS